MQDAGSSGGQRSWRQDLDPHLRPRVFDKIVRKLAQVYHGQLDSTDDISTVAGRFESKVFHEANSKEDYLKRISLRLVTLEQKQKQKLLQHAASGHRQQIQTRNYVLPVEDHAVSGGNSSITAMPQVPSMMSRHGRRSSQLQSLPTMPPGSGLVPNQPMAYPFAPNSHLNVRQEQPQVTGNLDQILNSQRAVVAPSAPGVQLSQKMVQPIATQNSKRLAMQMQPANISGCNPISFAHPQGQQLFQPNVQQNPLLRTNDIVTGMLPHEQIMVNQQGLGFNRDPMDSQKYQMLVAQQANVTKMHNGYQGAQNSQPGVTVGLQSTLRMHEQEALNQPIKMEPQPMGLPQPQQLITVSLQNNNMGSAGEDWREEMFQQMKALKDAYFSELMELDQVVLVPKITEKQLELLPGDKVERYKFTLHLKRRITLSLEFLRLQKSVIPDYMKGQLSLFVKAIHDLIGSYRRSKDRKAEICKSHISNGNPQIINLNRDQGPSGCSASHQKQQEQPVHSLLREDVAPTTPATQQINSMHLLGVGGSCFQEKSRGSVQSLPINKLQECFTPTLSHVIMPGTLKVSSPSASLKSTSPSPVTTPGAAEATALSSVSVKSILPSPVMKPGVVKVASPCASVKSTLPQVFVESASIQVASPCASVKSAMPSPFAKLGVIEPSSSISNSGCDPVAMPCPSVNSASPENIENFCAIVLQDNSAAARAQAVVRETATEATNHSRQVTTIKPIMPASPLQAQTADHEAEDNEHIGNEILVRTSSPSMLCSAANTISSVLNMNDWAPNREMGAFQETFFSQQCGSSTANKMKRALESTSRCSESAPLGSMEGCCMAFDCTALEAEYNAEHSARRQKTQNAMDTLLDEINSANSLLLNTFISIADATGTDWITSSNGGTLIKLSYTAISLAPDLVSLFATSGMSIVTPVKLLVPVDYPRSSPVHVCDQGDDEIRKRFSDISGAVDAAFPRALRGLPEPMSVLDMAMAWDASVRRAVVEFAQQHGGGTFSSSYCEWARC